MPSRDIKQYSIEDLIELLLKLDEHNQNMDFEIRYELQELRDSLIEVKDEVAKNSAAIKELESIRTVPAFSSGKYSHSSLRNELTAEIEKINSELNEIQHSLRINIDINSDNLPNLPTLPTSLLPTLPEMSMSSDEDEMIDIGATLLDFVVNAVELDPLEEIIKYKSDEKRVVV